MTDQDVLTYIKQFALVKNMLPSVKEISEGLHIGTGTVTFHMDHLTADGIIKREHGRHGYTVKGLWYTDGRRIARGGENEQEGYF